MVTPNKKPTDWSIDFLLEEVRDAASKRRDRSYCFVLGAGASASSGIPVARELAEQWVRRLHVRDQGGDPEAIPFEEWATAHNLDIKGFDFEQVDQFYPEIYDALFGDDPDQGQERLERIMTSEEVSPSVGYAILAQILTRTPNNVVVTTNFDHLISDAMFTFTTKEPLVVGHEELIGYISANMRRPLIAKIHRDLFLGPMNRAEELEKLKEGWVPALKGIFKQRIPIVIGYGGNDGTFMGLLREIEEGDMPGPMIWCYRRRDGKPRCEVMEMLARIRGVLVPIVGFDELMLQLGRAFDVPVVANQLDEVARQRGRRLHDQLSTIRSTLRAEHVGRSGKPKYEANIVLEALDETLDRQLDTPSDWWVWDLRAHVERDLELRAEKYREGVRECPRSPELADGLARTLAVLNDLETAEKFAQRAYDLDPGQHLKLARLLAFTNANKTYPKNPEWSKAEDHFQQAELQGPEDPEVLIAAADYARYRQDSRARKLYEDTLAVAPDHPGALMGIATLDLVSAPDSAREFALRAWDHAGDDEYLAAKAALLLAVDAQSRGEDDTPALARVKTLVERNYEPPLVTENFAGWLPYNNDYYQSIANAVADPRTLPKLAKSADWQELVSEPVDQAWPEERGIVSSEQFSLRYSIVGEGKSALAVGSSVYLPRVYTGKILDHLRMVLMDQRGFAPQTVTVAPAEAFEPQALIDDIELARSQLGLDRFVLIGHSMHGILALEYAKQFPQHVSHLVMIGTSPGLNETMDTMREEYWQENAAPARKAALRENIQRLPDAELEKLPPDEQWVARYRRDGPRVWFDAAFDASELLGGLHAQFPGPEVFGDVDITQGLASFECPVFLALGRYDFLSPAPTVWDEVKPKFHDLTIRIFEQSGHWPHYEEAEAFQTELIDWLKTRQ